MAWVIVLVAIGLEVMASLCLKAAEGFTRPLPIVGVIVGYLASFALLSVALKTLDLGPVYAVWAALGITGATIGGVVFFGERLSAVSVVGVAVLIVGVGLVAVGQGTTQ